MIIYRMTIGKNEDENLSFSKIYKAEMTEKSIDMFNWDKINRLDVLENDTVILLSKDVKMLESCSSGMGILLELQKKWDNIFNKENLEQFQEAVKHIENKETK